MIRPKRRNLIEVVTMSYATPIIFVVDDDVSVRESLELLIESAGWQAQTFASAQEFLARPPDQAGPSCLVLDVNLPDFTGPELHQSLAPATRPGSRRSGRWKGGRSRS